MRKRSLGAAAASAMWLWTAPVAHAQGDLAAAPITEDFSDVEGALDQAVVATASQSLEADSAAPATSTSISAEDLRRYGIRSLDEAINFLSLGMVTQNPLHSVDVGARGVILSADFGNHVLLLVNGHAMNEPWNGTAYFERGAAIPFELIDHIEIILGPGSVLYGSNAMLGVINVITKRATAYEGVHAAAESELATSFRAAAGAGTTFTAFGKPGEVTAAVEWYRQSGPAFNFGPQTHGNDAVTGLPKKFNADGTNAGTWGGKAKNSYWTEVPAGYVKAVLGRLQLDVHAALYKRGTPYINQFNQFVGDFDDQGSWERDRWLSADLKHKAALTTHFELRSRLYGDTYQYLQRAQTSAAEDCLDGQDTGCVRKALGLSRWAGIEEQGLYDWRNDGRFVTLLGADARVRHVGSQLEFYSPTDGPIVATAGRVRRTESSIGVYFQQTLKPLPIVDVNAGARLDADERFGNHVSPRAAIGLHAWAGAIVKAIYSEAFRAPTLYEQAYADPHNQVTAPDLRPEVVRSVEAVLDERHGTHHLLLGGFASFWQDMVVLETLSFDEIEAAKASGALSSDTELAVQYRNVATLRNYGVNAAYDGSALRGTLRFGATMTVARAQRKLPGGSSSSLTVTPNVFGNARVSYDLPGTLPSLSLASAFFGRRLADRANDGMFTPKPYAPLQMLLRATLLGAVPGVKGLSYRVVGDFATAARNPYVVGPNQAATPQQPSAELSPVDRFRATVGLQYDFSR